MKAKVSTMFYRKWELIPTNKKILTYIAEKQRRWTQSISRGFSNETFAQNNKKKSTVLLTLQWFCLNFYLCISCLFQRGEDGKGSPSLHRYDPCFSWRLQQIRRWSIFLNIYQYFSIFLRIFSLIETNILDAMAKYKKWQEKHGGNLQIRSFDDCHFSFLVKISRRNSKLGGVEYMGNCTTSGTLVLIFCYIFQC